MNNQKKGTMKKIRNWILLSLGVIMFGITGCEEDEVGQVLVIYPNDLIGDIIISSLETETFGIGAQIAIATNFTDSYIENPGVDMSSSLVSEYYDVCCACLYTYDYDAIVDDSNMNFESIASGQYETLRMTSDDKYMNSWIIKGVDYENEIITFIGSSIRDGEQYSKIYKDSFSSTIDFNIENLEVNRITGQIKNGIIDFVFYGKTSYGNSTQQTGKVQYSDYRYKITYE